MVTKPNRLAGSLPDARAIADELTAREISLSLGGSVYDPTDAVGRLLFNGTGSANRSSGVPEISRHDLRRVHADEVDAAPPS